MKNIIVRELSNQDIRFAIIKKGRLFTISLEKQNSEWAFFIKNKEQMTDQKKLRRMINEISTTKEAKKWINTNGIHLHELKIRKKVEPKRSSNEFKFLFE